MKQSRYKTRKRYRLTFVNENTFNAVWSVKLSRIKVWALTATTIAATATLVLALILATPLKVLLPGYLRPEQRHQTVRNTMRIDSIAERAAENEAYIANLTRILTDEIEPAPATPETSAATGTPDSLIAASERERQFVKQWEERERFNLTVLTPLAANGIAFHSPVAGNIVDTLLTGRINTLRFIAPARTPVTAIAEGTVIDSYMTDAGSTVTVQHPNDFVAKYSGLKDTFVVPGDKVKRGEALGPAGSKPAISIWHKGVSINPTDIIPL